ncbi:uncharacterized protein EV422DRAFT_556337 [Fimicolochytrium jonesii]|uniref:uncharacterized protein n=1 Tax=Fimicolochytrium jonesii TaxID=1396493 RepID=UPI0022FF3380|nr:uncharacterized protein EV422DRAFT_556337 [Fimicolochytrium jonesii]KAI8821617.1 hypothetical protein EV422DRAFT_556337 [Fimicolochytrium jonesii]
MASEKDVDDFDVDTFLRLESTGFNQDKEVERILKLHATTKNPLEILEHPLSVYITLNIDERATRVAFRKKSLLLHPDKCKHPRAQESFDILKKAETEVMDDEKRKSLLSFLRDSRDAVLRRQGIQGPVDEQEPRWQEMMKDDKLCNVIKLEMRRLFTEDEGRLRLRMKNEFDRRATEAEEKLLERKRKAEHDKLWEETRDARVGSWRNFVKKGPKKLKKPLPTGGPKR